MLVVCAILQAALAWYFICANYSKKHCNARAPQDSELYYAKYQVQRTLDLTMYGYSDLIEFKSYTEWVHNGISAPVCAFSKTSSITAGLLL
jgi:hypothetical protein